MTENHNQREWHSLCLTFTHDQHLIDVTWCEIEAAYQQAGRAYHTLTHISTLLHQIEEHAAIIQNKRLLLFAAFYHDIVYLPGSGSNEKDSAEIAEKRMRELQVPERMIRDTKVLILLTKSHADVSPSTPNDMRLFLDMDLSIIGEQPTIYARYCKDIRKEFQAFPDFLFNKGRRSFLQSQLKLPLIFHTDVFRHKYETQARMNMLTELHEKLD
jgi:predicted metal-dependent HD superfamily phosphohydrolase